MTSRVVNVRTLPADPATWPADVVYIGRRMWRGRFVLPQSAWANPFKIGRDGDRPEVIAKYEARLRGNPALFERLGELRGKTLACWCAPEACHGDVLARLVDEQLDRERRQRIAAAAAEGSARAAARGNAVRRAKRRRIAYPALDRGRQ